MTVIDNPLITHTGHKLTIYESKFIDEYIKSSNAAQAYLIAYGKDLDNPPKGYNVNANKILTRTHIREEIVYRTKLATNESIADAQEIMQYFTDVMRGNIKEQFGLEAPLAERTKAAQELAKRQIDMVQKAQANGGEAPSITIKLDWEKAPTNVSVVPSDVQDMIDQLMVDDNVGDKNVAEND